MEQFGSDEFQRRFALIYDRLITNKHVTDTVNLNTLYLSFMVKTKSKNLHFTILDN